MKFRALLILFILLFSFSIVNAHQDNLINEQNQNALNQLVISNGMSDSSGINRIVERFITSDYGAAAGISDISQVSIISPANVNAAEQTFVNPAINADIYVGSPSIIKQLYEKGYLSTINESSIVDYPKMFSNTI